MKKISASRSYIARLQILRGKRKPANQEVKTYAVRDDVGVALEGSLGVSVLGLIAGEVPDDQGLVTRSRQEHVGAVQSPRLAHNSPCFYPISTMPNGCLYPSCWKTGRDG